jgi:hypothetical protein
MIEALDQAVPSDALADDIAKDVALRDLLGMS